MINLLVLGALSNICMVVVGGPYGQLRGRWSLSNIGGPWPIHAYKHFNKNDHFIKTYVNSLKRGLINCRHVVTNACFKFYIIVRTTLRNLKPTLKLL